MRAECLVKSGLCDTTLENLLVVSSFLMITVGIGLWTSALILYIVRSRVSVDNVFKTDAESTMVYCSGLAFQNTSPCQTQVQV